MNMLEAGNSGQTEVDDVYSRCSPQRLTRSQISEPDFSRIVAEASAIEAFHFGENAFSAERIADDFSDPDNTVVMLCDSSNDSLAGFTYAMPVDAAYSSVSSFTQRKRHPATAYINDTALREEYRGKKLVGKLVGELERELLRRGYTHVERDAAAYNGYAASIQKYYGDRIEFAEEHEAPEGMQVFFRIRL